MFKSDPRKNEALDRAGKLVLKSAAATETDVEAAATSPFLFTRVRAAIAEEKRQREDAGGWVSMMRIAWRAVPAMALIALLAAVLTVWSDQSAVVTTQADDEPLIGALDPGVEKTVLTSRNGLSRDEVFNIVVDRNYGATGK